MGVKRFHKPLEIMLPFILPRLSVFPHHSQSGSTKPSEEVGGQVNARPEIIQRQGGGGSGREITCFEDTTGSPANAPLLPVLPRRLSIVSSTV